MSGIEGARIVDKDGNDVDIGAKQDEIIAALGGGAAPVQPVNGRKVIAVTDTALAIGAGAFKTLFITALIGNSAEIVLGASGVIHTEASRTGTALYPGDKLTIVSGNLDDYFINGKANDGVSFLFLT